MEIHLTQGDLNCLSVLIDANCLQKGTTAFSHLSQQLMAFASNEGSFLLGVKFLPEAEISLKSSCRIVVAIIMVAYRPMLISVVLLMQIRRPRRN